MSLRVLDFSDGFSSAANPSTSTGVSVGAVQDIASGGTITLSASLNEILKVQGDGAAVTCSNTPFGTGSVDNGKVVTISGSSDANAVTLLHNDASKGCILNGDATLTEYDAVTLFYNETSDRFEELSRNF